VRVAGSGFGANVDFHFTSVNPLSSCCVWRLRSFFGPVEVRFCDLRQEIQRTVSGEKSFPAQVLTRVEQRILLRHSVGGQL
jgi:hypothetical protein